MIWTASTHPVFAFTFKNIPVLSEFICIPEAFSPPYPAARGQPKTAHQNPFSMVYPNPLSAWKTVEVWKYILYLYTGVSTVTTFNDFNHLHCGKFAFSTVCHFPQFKIFSISIYFNHLAKVESVEKDESPERPFPFHTPLFSTVSRGHMVTFPSPLTLVM